MKSFMCAEQERSSEEFYVIYVCNGNVTQQIISKHQREYEKEFHCVQNEREAVKSFICFMCAMVTSPSRSFQNINASMRRQQATPYEWQNMCF